MKTTLQIIQEEFKAVRKELRVYSPSDVVSVKLIQTLGLLDSLCEEIKKFKK